MAKNKTVSNDNNVNDFLNNVKNEQKRNDTFDLINLMKEITGEEPKMWGASIVGFGEYHYEYKSGREGDMFLSGFSPRKQNIAIYIMAGVENYEKVLKNIGKYKIGKSCFYINKLDDIDLVLLKEMISDSVKKTKNKYN